MFGFEDYSVLVEGLKSKTNGPIRLPRLGSVIHCLKWVGFWFLCCHSFLLWMAVNDAEPWLPPVPETTFNVTFTNLNKFGNDTSGCPKSPDDSLRIMHEPSISFVTKPDVCSPPPYMLIMCLTAPKNFQQRAAIRKQIRDFNAKSNYVLRPLFVIGQGGLPAIQSQIEDEVRENNDILQSSMTEGYGKLSYKTNMAFIWTQCFCPGAKYVLKIDDDVVLNFEVLTSHIRAKHGTKTPELLIECPSVMRNMRPWRPRPSGGSSTIMGKWSVKTFEMNRRVWPDFCPGWAYLTTPSTAIRIAEMSANMKDDVLRVNRLDDIYMSGYVFGQIEGAKLEQLSGGYMGDLWNKYFSYCPFMGITKAVFFNDIVLSKGNYVKSGWFLWCAFWEYFILDNVEFLLPDILPDSMTKMCHR